MSKTKLFLLVITSFLLATLTVNAQLSTSGPTRPDGVDEGIRLATRDQVIIPGIPYYIWQHGCGPTALGMIMGYYDLQGHRFLVEGNAAGQTSEVNDMIAMDNGNIDCGNGSYSDHYHDYSCPKDYFGNILPDKSETGGAHIDNCVADFMKTSQSLYGLPYGWSGDSDILIAFTDYINLVAPHYITSTSHQTFPQTTWEEYMAEIDANRPVVLLVDTDGDGGTDHFITAIGYEEVGGINYYGCHDTWDDNMHWYQWRQISTGVSWGVYCMISFSISNLPKTIHVPADIATIGEAIEAADEGDTILVADGIYSGPGNRDIVLEGKPIILSENGPETTIIDCGGSESEPHSGITIPSGYGPDTKIDGLTIRNAYSTTIGAAISCANSTLLISNCIFENNYANRGGGMSIYGSTPIISNCIFRQNSGFEGGAIYLGNSATPEISECDFIENDATYGGGIYSYLSQPTIHNSSFIGNTSSNGGAYYNKYIGGTITNSNFCLNASSNGAAFYISSNGNMLTIDNCIIAFNTLSEAVDCSNPDNAPVLNCTDVFGNDGGDWINGIEEQETLNNNFCSNPYFCSMTTGDYSLHVSSPCAPDNSNCGTLVGVLDVACYILYTCGDVNDDDEIDILDIVFLINHKYKEGPAPIFVNSGDVNSDLTIDILDIVYLINYKYKSGPSPNCPE